LIAVDYTRSADAVNKKIASAKKIQEKREGSVDSIASGNTLILSAPNTNLLRAHSAAPSIMKAPSEPLKTDLVALFVDRYVPMSDEDSKAMMDEMNDFLESMDCFVFENKRFVPLPKTEIGQFYSENSYLFICRYWKIDEDLTKANEDENEENESLIDNSLECKLYFWQGRDANNAGWLTFSFSLKKKFKDIEIIKLNQQQESPQFLSHFKRKFIIHKGKRGSSQSSHSNNNSLSINKPNHSIESLPDTTSNKTTINETKMYHLRKNPHSAICTRCIQLDSAKAQNLCSQYCYIVLVPFENSDGQNVAKGIVYVWIGSKADQDEARLAEEIAEYMFSESYSIQVLSEGEEPETFFWHGLEGKKPYDSSAEYIDYMRLFRCSNDRGYFAVTEKCIDFCQDDLCDDDVMILDTGEIVYLWVGPTSTEIEVKLAFKSAQCYIQHLKNKQPNRTRKLLITTKNREPVPFRKCFHGWSKHRDPPRNLEKKMILRHKE